MGHDREYPTPALRTLGSLSIDDGNGSENVSFKMNSRFFQSLSRLFQFAENGKCRWISLKSFETTLAAVILGFSILSGTNPQI